MSLDPRLLDRLAKLLRLANSANPHEAAAAEARAQALIAEHRLEGWVEREKADPVQTSPDPLDVSRRLRRWKVALANILAAHCQCAVYVSPGTRKTGGDRLFIVGRTADAQRLREAYADRIPHIERLTLQFGQGGDRDWAEGFRFGLIDALSDNLSPPKEESPGLIPSKAVVVEAVEAFVASELHLKPGRAIRVVAEAYDRGKDVGATAFSSLRMK